MSEFTSRFEAGELDQVILAYNNYVSVIAQVPVIEQLLPIRAPEVEIRQARAIYFGLISEVDHHLGRIFDYLRSFNQYNSTLIIFTSDHGEQLGDHFIFSKGGYFDQSNHIPIIIKYSRDH